MNGATTTDVSHGSSTCVRVRNVAAGGATAAGDVWAASAACSAGAGTVFSADPSSSEESDSSSLPRSRRDFLRLRDDARVASTTWGAWQCRQCRLSYQAP